MSGLVLIFLSVLYGFCEACSSRNALKPRPPHVPRPKVSYRTYPCQSGLAERLCMNGGTCFTWFENSTDSFCKCKEGFCGLTCGDKYTRHGCFSTSVLIVAETGLARPEGTFSCPTGLAKSFCHNGGTCFTAFENATEYACHCPEGFCGLTCSEKYTRYGCFSAYLVLSASVAGTGTAVVFVVVVAVVVIIGCTRRTKTVDVDVEPRPLVRCLSMPGDESYESYLHDLDDGDGRLCDDYSTVIGLI